LGLVIVSILLNVPLTMILKIGLESSPEGRWLAVMLSDEVEWVDKTEQALLD